MTFISITKLNSMHISETGTGRYGKLDTGHIFWLHFWYYDAHFPYVTQQANYSKNLFSRFLTHIHTLPSKVEKYGITYYKNAYFAMFKTSFKNE